jgi:hypothetical protein
VVDHLIRSAVSFVKHQHLEFPNAGTVVILAHPIGVIRNDHFGSLGFPQLVEVEASTLFPHGAFGTKGANTSVAVDLGIQATRIIGPASNVGDSSHSPKIPE